MNYLNGINDLEQAKLQYRKLAKQLHPDAGGTAKEFQKLQEEYKTVLLKIKQNQNGVIRPNLKPSAENELLTELGKLGKILLRQQLPQKYLTNRIETIDSPFKKELIKKIINFLNEI